VVAGSEEPAFAETCWILPGKHMLSTEKPLATGAGGTVPFVAALHATYADAITFIDHLEVPLVRLEILRFCLAA
jgi:hypothetical protein